MYHSVTSKVGDVVGIVCSYIYISILFCLSPELQLHQLLSYRQLPLIIVVDLWLVLEFFLFLVFGFMSHDFRQLRLGGVFSISALAHRNIIWFTVGDCRHTRIVRTGLPSAMIIPKTELAPVA